LKEEKNNMKQYATINKKTGLVEATGTYHGYWKTRTLGLLPDYEFVHEEEFFDTDGKETWLCIRDFEFCVEIREGGKVVYAELYKNYWKALEACLAWLGTHNQESLKFFGKTNVWDD